MKITVIGAGPGKTEYLTGKAREEIERAGLILTTARLGECFSALNSGIRAMSLSDMIKELSEYSGDAAVIASGDTGLYSISSVLARTFPEREIEFIPGISSLQYFSAKLGLSYEGIRCVSLHGRVASGVPYVSYNRECFFLTGGSIRAHDLIAELESAGLGGVYVCAGENLSLENERIVKGTADELGGLRFCDLCVVYVRNDDFTDCGAPVRDADLVRADTPMTKQEVRDLSLAFLDIRPKDTVYDIGSGTGSVSAAMARKASEGTVYALERDETAIALSRKNFKKLGAFNVTLKKAFAPEGIAELPAPDKVFVGGSGGNMRGVFAAVLEKNQDARITVNAVTLESLAEATACFEENGLDYECVCVNAARSCRAGRYHLMKANNPVYIITGQKIGGKP